MTIVPHFAAPLAIAYSILAQTGQNPPATSPATAPPATTPAAPSIPPVELPQLPVPGVTPPGGTPPGPVLTVDEAVDLAEANAFANRFAASTTERSRQQYFLAETSLAPTIGGSLGVQRFGLGSQNFGTQSFSQPLYGVVAGLSVTLPLDIAGNLSRQIAASRRQYAANREAEYASRNTTRLNARQAYFEALRALATVGVARQNIANAEAQVRQAEAQFAQQFIARIDVERLRSQLTQYQNELLVAENNYQLAVQRLNTVLARPIETPTTLVDPGALPEPPEDADRLVAEGEATRPETLQLRQQIQGLELTARAQEAGQNPQASVTLAYQRNLNPSSFSQTDTTTGTLNLSIPIFDAGATRARVRAARQDAESARINLEQTRLNISADVRSALTQLRTARARLATATAQIGYAAEVERLARVRRDAGEATFLEVIDAQTQLAQARNQYVSARYDYLNAFAQLQRAVGRDDVGTPLTNLDPNSATATGAPPLRPTPGNPPRRESGVGVGSNEPPISPSRSNGGKTGGSR